jgi:hypothetical protein
MILVLGHVDDRCAVGTYRRLLRDGAEAAFADAADLLKGAELSWRPGSPPEQSFLTFDGSRFPLSQVSGVLERLDWARLAAAAAGTPDAEYTGHELRATLLALLNSLEARVINRPIPGRLWGSAWTMMRHAGPVARCGFQLPRMVVTSSPHDADEAYERLGRSVLVGPGAAGGPGQWVSGETGRETIQAAIACHPVCLREALRGERLQAFTVGDRVIGAFDSSPAVSSDCDTAPLQRTVLPFSIPERCLQLARMLQLEFLQLHLVCTQPGDVYCLDVSGSPSAERWSERLEEEIAGALAERLAEAERGINDPGSRQSGRWGDGIPLSAAAGAAG